MRCLNVLLLSLGLLTAAIHPSAAAVPRDTIAGIAIKSGHFKTLVAALKATGLSAVLNSPGAYTVFAPTDTAFDQLPAGTVASLLKPSSRGKLKAILLYHVVGKIISASAIPYGITHVPTLNGKTVRVRKSHSGVRVNGAAVTTADIRASNGVIHVIDAVLLP